MSGRSLFVSLECACSFTLLVQIRWSSLSGFGVLCLGFVSQISTGCTDSRGAITPVGRSAYPTQLTRIHSRMGILKEACLDPKIPNCCQNSCAIGHSRRICSIVSTSILHMAHLLGIFMPLCISSSAIRTFLWQHSHRKC